MPQDNKDLFVIIDEAILTLRKRGITGIGKSQTDLLVICREHDEGRNMIQPFVAVGGSIEDPDDLEKSIEHLALWYFDKSFFGLKGDTFFFAVVECIPGNRRYARAIAGVVDRRKTRRSLFEWLWGRS